MEPREGLNMPTACWSHTTRAVRVVLATHQSNSDMREGGDSSQGTRTHPWPHRVSPRSEPARNVALGSLARVPAGMTSPAGVIH